MLQVCYLNYIDAYNLRREEWQVTATDYFGAWLHYSRMMMLWQRERERNLKVNDVPRRVIWGSCRYSSANIWMLWELTRVGHMSDNILRTYLIAEAERVIIREVLSTYQLKNSVRTAKKTEHLPTAKIYWLIIFKEMILFTLKIIRDP
jgi:hypothetical protein